jgi:diguanylate cyclase (GGDEF)-like protein
MRTANLKSDRECQAIVAVEILNEQSPNYALFQKLEELEKLALIDPLLEIGNRRFMELNLRGRLEELKRYGWPFGVLFIDIDDFKEINDKYGHDTGDRVLKMVSRTMSNSIRSFDILGRWGGEEFIAIVVNVNRSNIHTIADRFRRLVEQTSITVGQDTIKVTISIGGTLVQKKDTLEQIIKRADRLMYESKRAGKNRITTDADII